jgi:hypothetical protein
MHGNRRYNEQPGKCACKIEAYSQFGGGEMAFITVLRRPAGCSPPAICAVALDMLIPTENMIAMRERIVITFSSLSISITEEKKKSSSFLGSTLAYDR